MTLTQGPLPGSLSVPLVYNLGAGETLSLNGNQLYGDAVILADSNVGDLDTETVNVTGTVTFSDMHVATDSLHFFGGTLDFTGVSNFGGNEFTTGYTVFNDNLAGTGTLNVDGGNHDGGAMEINGSVTSGLTFDINPGAYAPTASLQIDDPATFHALIALPVTPYTVASSRSWACTRPAPTSAMICYRCSTATSWWTLSVSRAARGYSSNRTRRA